MSLIREGDEEEGLVGLKRSGEVGERGGGRRPEDVEAACWDVCKAFPCERKPWMGVTRAVEGRSRRIR